MDGILLKKLIIPPESKDAVLAAGDDSVICPDDLGIPGPVVNPQKGIRVIRRPYEDLSVEAAAGQPVSIRSNPTLQTSLDAPRYTQIRRSLARSHKPTVLSLDADTARRPSGVTTTSQT